MKTTIPTELTDRQYNRISVTVKAIAWVIITVVLTVLVHCLVYWLFTIAPQENTTRVNETVKAICSWSRDMESGAAEEACGIAQDTSMTEFKCPDYEAPNISCWIEDKR